jgi:hypothetical protein
MLLRVTLLGAADPWACRSWFNFPSMSRKGKCILPFTFLSSKREVSSSKAVAIK